MKRAVKEGTIYRRKKASNAFEVRVVDVKMRAKLKPRARHSVQLTYLIVINEEKSCFASSI